MGEFPFVGLLHVLLLMSLLGNAVASRQTILIKEDVKSNSVSGEKIFPKELKFKFTIDNEDVMLNLLHNGNVDHNAPVTFEDDSILSRDSTVQNVGLYQDIEKQAAISITSKRDPINTKRYARTLEGSFVNNGKHYTLAPAETGGLEPIKPTSHILIERELYHVDAQNDATDNDYYADARKILDQHILHGLEYIKSKEQYKNLESSNTFEKTSTQRSRLFKAKYRHKRDVTVLVYHVEILLVLDHTIWESYLELAKNDEAEAMRKIRYHFSHMINGVDMAFSSIDPMTYGMSIDVWLKGFHIGKTRNQSMWTVNNIMPGNETETEYRNIGIHGDLVLDALKEWHKTGNRTWFNPDHLMLITRYNIGRSKTIGYATIGGICTALGNSIVEDHGFHSWSIAAHELGHSLGARHDGLNNECSKNASHIMSPTVGSVHSLYLDNVYTFSPCSVQEMKNELLGKEPAQYVAMPRVCLHNRMCTHVGYASDVTVLPGSKYSADEQCRIRFGLNSSTCGATSVTVCQSLQCTNHNGKCKVWSPGAADGTTCGVDQWCMKGRCIPKNDTDEHDTNATCTEYRFEDPVPEDCKDTANFVFNLLDSDGNSTKMDCAGMALFTPYLCFTNEVLFKHCCFTCHIYGLVQSNSAGRATNTTDNSTTSTTTTTSSSTAAPTTTTTTTTTTPMTTTITPTTITTTSTTTTTIPTTTTTTPTTTITPTSTTTTTTVPTTTTTTATTPTTTSNTPTTTTTNPTTTTITPMTTTTTSTSTTATPTTTPTTTTTIPTTTKTTTPTTITTTSTTTPTITSTTSTTTVTTPTPTTATPKTTKATHMTTTTNQTTITTSPKTTQITSTTTKPAPKTKHSTTTQTVQPTNSSATTGVTDAVSTVTVTLIAFLFISL